MPEGNSTQRPPTLSARTMRGPFFRWLEVRRCWKELSWLSDEVVRPQDAEDIGITASWFNDFLSSHLGGAAEATVRELKFAMNDRAIVDLIRFKGEQRILTDTLGSLMEVRFSPFDAVAAGVVDANFLVLSRVLFPGESEVGVADLLRYLRRPIVRRLLGGTESLSARSRVRRVHRAAVARRAREKELGPLLGRTIDVEEAVLSGATDRTTRGLLRRWFGELDPLEVRHLLLVPQEPAFARLATWRVMMATA